MYIIKSFVKFLNKSVNVSIIFYQFVFDKKIITMDIYILYHIIHIIDSIYLTFNAIYILRVDEALFK